MNERRLSHAPTLPLPGLSRTWASSRTWVRVLVAAAILLALVHAFYYFCRTVDDAFISLRYAERFVAGDGLTYNDGERVEGFSNPTWTFLQAALIGLGVDGVVATKLLSLASYAALLALAWPVARRVFDLHPLWSALVLVSLAASSSIASWAMWGLETPLFLALVLATLLAFHLHIQRPTNTTLATLTLVAIALSATRPEAPLYVIALGLAHLRHWRVLIAPAIAIALVAAALLAWRYAYYDHLLPQTAAAKQGAGIDLARLAPLVIHGAPPAEIVHLLGAIAGAVWLARKTLVPLALIVANLVFVASVTVDWMPNQRHFLPLVMLAPFVWCALLQSLTRRRVRWLGVLALTSQAVSTFAIDARFSVYDFKTHGHSENWAQFKTPSRWRDARDAFVRTPPRHVDDMAVDSLGMIDQLFKVIEASALPERETWYLGRDIGMVGYYSPIQVIDTEGLFTPFLTDSPGWVADRTIDDALVDRAFVDRPVTAELLDGWRAAVGRRPDLLAHYDVIGGSPTFPWLVRRATIERPTPAEVGRRYQRVAAKFRAPFFIGTLYGENVGAAFEKRWQWLEPQLAVAEPRTVPVVPDGLSPGATLEKSRVRLHGCRVEGAPEPLLVCYWQSLQRVHRPLRIFVHATPPAGGTPHHRRDHDAYAGLFPVKDWQRGEIVRDAIPLDLPPGTWSLRVGLFDGDYRSPAVPSTLSLAETIDTDGRILGPTVEVR